MKDAVELGSFWLPKQSSTLASGVDDAWAFAYWLAVIFFVGILTALITFVVKYRRKTDHDVTSMVDHSTLIEITWTVIPSLLCVGLFLMGFKGYIEASVAPANAMEIQVTAQKWSWGFTYPNGVQATNELRVPLNKPVKLIMSSTDVLHSFYVPEFRIKQDVVPGNYTTLWFQATEPGEKQVFCTQYCGMDHSNMLAKIIVMPEQEYKQWLDAGDADKNLTPVALGQKLFTEKTCIVCHSIADMTVKTGPSLKGVFGRTETMSDDSKVVVDENYVRESIVNPTAKVVKGFPPAMPVFKGQLKDKQIDALIAYLKEQK